LSHHLYHWQQLVVFTAPTEARPVSVPSTRTVGVNPVAGGGEGGGGLGGGGEGGGGEGGGGGATEEASTAPRPARRPKWTPPRAKPTP
jgi:hypothetical protein